MFLVARDSATDTDACEEKKKKKKQTCTGPLGPGIYSRQPAPILARFSSFFFFILTLIDCGEIKNTAQYGGEPALHIVVLTAMNCPSGPFRS